MIATVSVMAERIGQSTFAQHSRKIGELLDCVIPIVLAIAVTVGMCSVTLDLVR